MTSEYDRMNEFAESITFDGLEQWEIDSIWDDYWQDEQTETEED